MLNESVRCRDRTNGLYTVQQHESYESCAFVYSVMHEINDAENNMSNA